MESVLITGGTGSLGQALVAELLNRGVPRIAVYSRDEKKQADMAQRFPANAGDPMRYFVGDVRDFPRLRRAMHGIDTVIHAAALKRVEKCENDPAEAVKTNILGTVNVIEAALDGGVKRVLAISTDKCVAPINMYGASKLVLEKLCVAANVYSGIGGPVFSCVRYGNVATSNGSVIPLWREQMRRGLPMTLTSKLMSRFLMTLPEAVALVMRGLEADVPGIVRIPKLPSARMVDVAAQMGDGYPLDVTGIRAGEKLAEVLVASEEVRQCRDIGQDYAIFPADYSWPLKPFGKLVPEDFVYRSNVRVMGRDELAAWWREHRMDEPSSCCGQCARRA